MIHRLTRAVRLPKRFNKTRESGCVQNGVFEKFPLYTPAEYYIRYTYYMFSIPPSIRLNSQPVVMVLHYYNTRCSCNRYTCVLGVIQFRSANTCRRQLDCTPTVWYPARRKFARTRFYII